MSTNTYTATLTPADSATPGNAIQRRVAKTTKRGPEGCPLFEADDGFWIEIRTEPDDFYSMRNAGWPDGHRGYLLTELRPVTAQDEPDCAPSTARQPRPVSTRTLGWSPCAELEIEEIANTRPQAFTTLMGAINKLLDNPNPPGSHPSGTDRSLSVDGYSIYYAVTPDQIRVDQITLPSSVADAH